MDPIVAILDEERLNKAIRINDVINVRNMLDNGVNPNRFIKKAHPLFLAFRYGGLFTNNSYKENLLVEMFLDHPLIDLSIVDDKGKNVLNYAINYYGKVIERIIETGRFNITNNVSYLTDAINTGRIYPVETLLRHNVLVDEERLIKLFSYVNDHNIILDRMPVLSDDVLLDILIWAVQITNVELIRSIVNRYHNVRDIINQLNYGYAPLHFACIEPSVDIDIIKILLDNGADPNVDNNVGNTSLHLAAKGGNSDIVKILLCNGADKTIKNDDGKDAYTYTDHENIKELIDNFCPFDVKEPCED